MRYRLSMSGKKRLLAGVVVIVVFILIHMIADPVFGDEVGFRRDALQYNYNYLLYVYHRYFTWSSRFLLDLLMLSLPSLPTVLWKVLDVGVVIVLYWLLTRFSGRYFEPALLLCTYPFMHMGSAGWIATTTIYLWPFTAALLAFFLLVHKDSEEKLSCSVTYFILIIYAANNEILACLYTGALMIYLYWGRERIKKQRSQLLWIFISLIICCLGVINVLACPGNSVRIGREVTRWMPEFYKLNILEKMRICIVATLQHFTSVPNIIFMLFAFLITWHVWNKAKRKWHKVCGVVPLFISTILTGYYFIVNIVIHRNINYLQPDIMVKTGSHKFWSQMLLVILAVIYLAVVVWALCFLWKEKEEKMRQAGIYMGGLVSRFVLVFSPTMLASGTRIYFVFYMSLIWLEITLIKRIKDRHILRIVYCILGIGIIINLCMVYMMQQKYS